MTRPETIARKTGTIVCIKKHHADPHATNANHQRACEIVRRHTTCGPLLRENRLVCSQRFSCLVLRGDGDVDEGCIAELHDAGLLDGVESDFEIKACSSWAEHRVGMSSPHQTSSSGTTEADVDVFILDTGVDPDNPYLNLVETRSFVDDEPEARDLNGHGTFCASIVGARGSSDVVGVVPGARIHGLKVLGKEGGGSMSDIIDAVEYVALFKERNPESRVVVNMSLGGYVGDTVYRALDKEIVEAQNQNDLLFVVAAGNDSYDASLYTPAHVKTALTVGSYDRYDRFSTFSNFGHAVDVLAPGTDVQATGLAGEIQIVSGTSFAAPFVTGVVARNLLNHGTGKTPTARMIGDLIGGSKVEPFITAVPDGTARNSVHV